MLTRSLRLRLPLLAVAVIASAAAQDTEPSVVSPVANRLGSPASSSAASSTATLIYTNIPGLPQANVPGLPGVTFDPGTGTTDIDRVFGSPGGHWILTALADLPTAEDEVVIVNGVLVQQEGQPGAWTGGVENCGTVDQRCSVNDAGDFTFATNTDGPTTADDYIVTSQTQGFVANPGGSSGNLCVVGSVGRYVGPGQVQSSGASGSFSLGLDLNMTPQPTGFVSVAAGETWNFQTWHRDVMGGWVTSNFTNALEIQFQ